MTAPNFPNNASKRAREQQWEKEASKQTNKSTHHSLTHTHTWHKERAREANLNHLEDVKCVLYMCTLLSLCITKALNGWICIHNRLYSTRPRTYAHTMYLFVSVNYKSVTACSRMVHSVFIYLFSVLVCFCRSVDM